MKIGRLLRRLLVGACAFLSAAALCGALYQRWQEWGIERRFDPSGEMIPVGGYSLHLWCRGSAHPTILVDPGGYGGSVAYTAELIDRLADRHRACAYDPPGQGWSEAGPEPGNILERARAFQTLVSRAELATPLILVGESSGAHVVRLFTADHPESVGGLVLVDPAFDDVDRERAHWSESQRRRAERLRELAKLLPLASEFGVHRLLLGPAVVEATELLPSKVRPLVREQMLGRRSVRTMVARGIDRGEGLIKVREATIEGDLPLVVVTAGREGTSGPTLYHIEKQNYHSELAATSSRGRHVVLENTPHAVIGSAPERVADVIEWVIEKMAN